MPDIHLEAAVRQVETVCGGRGTSPAIRSFFDEPTNTASHVVYDPVSKLAAVIDSVLDFDAAAARTSTASADEIIAFVKGEGLTVEWLLETHAHADHLSAAPYIQERLAACRTGIFGRALECSCAAGRY
jgi:glyoxylase-like metal-dependent hydrolase (beta-lactamase superfamily II)